jgi:single-strand selective monofunctional uracil DNA glycosylase
MPSPIRPERGKSFRRRQESLLTEYSTSGKCFLFSPGGAKESVNNQPLIDSAKRLRDAVGRLRFAPPVSYVYNPLDYAWPAHEAYLKQYANAGKRIIFLGMNPGPFGMAQTGVPFGEISAVRDWLSIQEKIGKPDKEHPKRPVLGFDCPRCEVSGQRLWGLFAKSFVSAKNFSKEHLVMNYCPLAFIESTGRNRTPDKLLASERAALFRACDEHLREAVHILKPEWLIGIGDFAAKRAEDVFPDGSIKIGRILHPSPASPAANKDWAGVVTRQLREMGAWKR